MTEPTRPKLLVRKYIGVRGPKNDKQWAKYGPWYKVKHEDGGFADMHGDDLDAAHEAGTYHVMWDGQRAH